MKRMRYRLTAISLIVVLVAALVNVKASAAYVGDKEITSKGACVLDFDTGVMLFGYEEETQRVPASMTKVLTAYVIYDAIKAGEIKLDTAVKISTAVSDFSYNREYSNVPLPRDISVSINSLLDVVLVNSACAAAVALGEGLCGSEEAFAVRMNKKVAQLGIDAVFYDAFGGSPDNRISPRGMAELSRSLIIEHPEVLKKTQQKTVTFRGVEYKNTNPLLDQYEGLDGLKTGYTDPAMYCFTATAERDGRRLVSVTMGSASGTARGTDSRVLLDYGFAVADSLIASFTGGGGAEEGAGSSLPGGSDVSEGDSAQLQIYYMEYLRRLTMHCIAYLESEQDRPADLRLLSAFVISVMTQYCVETAGEMERAS